MEVKCFACDELIEGGGADVLVDQFVAHGETSHDWPYPEQAIRNYARNYAEATERLSRDTERLDEIGEVEVHPVTIDRIDDWLDFFDRTGFAGNPDWASCYCLEPHQPATPENPERAWGETRELMRQLLADGRAFGYLAYVGGTPAGWVNASFRSEYGLYRDVDPGGPDPTAVIGVSCFVVAPPFRRHGIAGLLLERVMADARSRGSDWVESYPLNEPEQSDAGHFRGPRAMYDGRGFNPIEVRARDTVMRRSAG